MFAQRAARHTGIISRGSNFIVVAALLAASGAANAWAEPISFWVAPATARPRFDLVVPSTIIVNQTGQRMTFTISGGELLGIFDLDNNRSIRLDFVNGEERYINGRPSSSSIHVQQQRLQPGKRHVARVISAGAYRDAQGRTVSFSEVGWTVSN